MKKSLLLTTALCATLAASATDYAPNAWRFKDMKTGVADIFIEEMGSCAWNCGAGSTGFRLADNGEGGVGLANQGSVNGGTNADNYASLSEEEKAYLEDFYEHVYIVDGGSENLLCMIGKAATATYPGATAFTNSFANATLFWLGGNENSTTTPVMPLAQCYRLTIEYRIITTLQSGAATMNLSLATSRYDAIDKNGPFQALGTEEAQHRKVQLPLGERYNDSWLKATMDFYIEDNTDPKYPELPFVIKMWLGNGILDNSVVLFRSFKLEDIEEADAVKDKPFVIGVSDFKDTSGVGVEISDFTNDAIVTAANGNITVIDANAPVEVYNMAGAKVASVAAPATVETISLDMNGVFVVKVGDKVQKVIL